MSAFIKNISSPQSTNFIGTKISSHNNLPIISTGIPSLNAILSLPLNSILLLKQDSLTSYAKTISQYFIAQGLASQHHVLFIGGDHLSSIETQTEQLMDVVGVDDKGNALIPEEDDEDEDVTIGKTGGITREMGNFNMNADRMKIAWRYQSLPRFSSSINNSSPISSTTKKQSPQIPFCNIFNITKKMNPEVIKSAKKTGYLTLLPISEVQSSQDVYDKYYTQIEQYIQNFLKTKKEVGHLGKPVLRIVIQSFAGPLWKSTTPQSSYKFIYKLKNLLQIHSTSIGITVLVTVHASLYYNDSHHVGSHSYIRGIERLVDGVIEVESFAGSNRMIHPAYTTKSANTPVYHGLIHPIKLPCKNTLLPAASRHLSASQLRSLAFRLRKKSFTIETFHLPPTDNDEGEAQTNGGGCGSTGGGNGKFDF